MAAQTLHKTETAQAGELMTKQAGSKNYRGMAVAEKYLQAVKEQGTKLLGLLNMVYQMDTAEQGVFRRALDSDLKVSRDKLRDMRETLKTAKESGGVDDETIKTLQMQVDLATKAERSATVRVSEAINFSKACEAGWEGFNVGVGYHANIAEARVFNKGKADADAAKRGGRPMKGADVILAEKVKALIEEGRLLLDEVPEVFARVKKVAVQAGWKADPSKVKQQPVKAEGEPLVRHASPTQREDRKAKNPRRPGRGKDRRVDNKGFEARTHEAPATPQ